jgi:hypothetical protein
MDLAVVEFVPRDDGLFEEPPPPPTPMLASRHVTILDVYGSRMYAGAPTLQAHLPDPGQARSPVVVLRLRRTGHIDGPVRTFEASPVVGESARAACRAAESWLVKRKGK